MKTAKLITLDEIPSLAKQVAKTLRGGEIFALIGTLGSGKTTFVKALGKELKIKHKITSPTFALMHAFPLPKKNKRPGLTLYHLDLYRTKNFREVTALGLLEIWGRKDTLTFIEWADKIKRHLPKKTKILKFK